VNQKQTLLDFSIWRFHNNAFIAIKLSRIHSLNPQYIELYCWIQQG